MVFKAILFNYATGKMIPESIDTHGPDGAFASRS